MSEPTQIKNIDIWKTPIRIVIDTKTILPNNSVALTSLLNYVKSHWVHPSMKHVSVSITVVPERER